jgi:hypothetical protein
MTLSMCTPSPQAKEIAPDRNHSIAVFEGFATMNSDVTKGNARWWR